MGQMLSRMASLGIAQGADADEGGGDPELVYLWSETVPVWNVWQALQTQWHEGMSGRTGLNYAGVFAYLDECRLRGRKRRETVACIREAEGAWLEVHHAAAQRRAASAKNSTAKR